VRAIFNDIGALPQKRAA